MVDNTYVETLQRKPSYIEDLEKGIFDSLFYERDPETGDYRKDEEGNKVFGGLLGTSVPQEINREALFNLPDYVVAALDPLQTQAYTKIGSDAFLNRLDPYFKTGTDPTTGQESALSKALGTVPGELAKGLGSFDPSEIDPETGELKIDRFMNPYQQEVIDEAIKQIDRQSKLARIADDARAIQAGAFGGSRQGVQRAETASRVQEAKNKTISDLLSKGYSSALSSSMAAEESARDRALKSGQLTGGLGQQYGSLAGTSADIGRVYSGITGQDLAEIPNVAASPIGLFIKLNNLLFKNSLFGKTVVIPFVRKLSGVIALVTSACAAVKEGNPLFDEKVRPPNPPINALLNTSFPFCPVKPPVAAAPKAPFANGLLKIPANPGETLFKAPKMPDAAVVPAPAVPNKLPTAGPNTNGAANFKSFFKLKYSG